MLHLLTLKIGSFNFQKKLYQKPPDEVTFCLPILRINYLCMYLKERHANFKLESDIQLFILLLLIRSYNRQPK